MKMSTLKNNQEVALTLKSLFFSIKTVVLAALLLSDEQWDL